MQQIPRGATLAEVEMESFKETPLKSLVIIVIKRGILQEIVYSLRSQKTSIGFSNFRVDDWC